MGRIKIIATLIGCLILLMGCAGSLKPLYKGLPELPPLVIEGIGVAKSPEVAEIKADGQLARSIFRVIISDSTTILTENDYNYLSTKLKSVVPLTIKIKTEFWKFKDDKVLCRKYCPFSEIKKIQKYMEEIVEELRPEIKEAIKEQLRESTEDGEWWRVETEIRNQSRKGSKNPGLPKVIFLPPFPIR